MHSWDCSTVSLTIKAYSDIEVCVCVCVCEQERVGIAQWLERWTRDQKIVGSNPCWNGGIIFFSRINFLYWLLFRYPFHPCITAVARKRSRSFWQKHKWQVTAKHTYTLRMWLCMKWHGAWLYGVYRTELAPRWQQFHVAPAMPALKYTTSVDIQKNAL